MPKFDGPRFERKKKKRTANRVLNFLIGFVCMLILFFFIITWWSPGSDDTAAPPQGNSGGGEEESTEEGGSSEPDDSININETNDDTDDTEETPDDSPSPEDPDTAVTSPGGEDANQSGEEQENPTSSNEEQGNTGTEGDGNTGNEGEADTGSEESAPLIIDSNDDPNVLEVMEGPWGPTGTSQSGEHTTNFDVNSTDGAERLDVISLATGLPKNDITIWWNGNYNGNTNHVVATVSPNDQSAFFRLYMQWVPNKGWQVTEMQRLKENDQG
ncbi:DUF1510 family protein [Aureibacillus halotolerans]|uniref:Uncharacterized protein DUF1510 n=1 Tax=Aureibacillus halotolerans TaxID=1508390 RepID=A0A4V3D4Y5_9BACI|nr:DUF1510 family protein [Aureibacillus halotolerans]TDQ38017.1 uncharacterized protein DUF1510 [Aureibacillus halotolerans]